MHQKDHVPLPLLLKNRILPEYYTTFGGNASEKNVDFDEE